MHSDNELDQEELRIAKEATQYLREHDLVLQIAFNEDEMPSAEVADFIRGYMTDAECDSVVGGEIACNIACDFDLEDEMEEGAL